MMETVAAVAERTRKAGKHAAIYVVEPAIAGRVVSMGYRLLATGSEHALISLGAKTLLKDIKDSIGA
jgi:4-hydroxy-2-oxoheptanedioate aldolase